MTDGTKSETPAPRGAPSVTPGNLRFGAIGAVAGLLVGYLLGHAGSVSGTSDKDSTAGATSGAAPNPSAAGSARPASTGPGDFALALALPASEPALKGTWTKSQIGQHAVMQTVGPEAGIAVNVNPAAGSYGLAVVGQALGVPAGETLDIGVRLNKKEIGRWPVDANFSMQALTIDAAALKPGANLVEFTLPASTGEKRPTLALESLHITPLISRAEVGLAELSAQGNLVTGFYGKEGEGAEACTWSAGLKTQIGLLMGPLNTEYDLELQGYAFGPLAPLDVEAVVNSRSIGRARVDKGPRYVFHAPAGAFKTGYNSIEFIYAKTIKPSASTKGSQDQRDLAIRILKVSATPAATPLH